MKIPKKRILLVDDDEHYRSALKSMLILQGHSLTVAENGKVAQKLLDSEPFDLLISDIRMPELDGVSLLTWLRAKSQMPVILITGFSEILETKEALELGASDFLLKPFKSDEIAKAIDTVLTNPDLPEPTTDQDDQFCRLPLEDFVSGSRIHFSIYVRISSTKYLKIAYVGQDISMERIRSYKTKGVQYLYLTREDFGKYVGFNVDLAKRVNQSSTLSDDKKRRFLRYSGEVILQQVYVQGLDRETFGQVKEFTETVVSAVSTNGEAFALLDALNSHAEYLYAHSLGVSMYAVMVAKEMSWQSTPTLFRIALAGLFHDIGLKELPKHIIESKRAALSQADRAAFETHPVRGMELLNEIRGIPSDAILVAYQHHEDCTGSGYPQKLLRGRIHPISRLMSVVDLFCELAIKSPWSPGMSGIEAIQKLRDHHASQLDGEVMSTLSKVFRLPAQNERRMQ